MPPRTCAHMKSMHEWLVGGNNEVPKNLPQLVILHTHANSCEKKTRHLTGGSGMDVVPSGADVQSQAKAIQNWERFQNSGNNLVGQGRHRALIRIEFCSCRSLETAAGRLRVIMRDESLGHEGWRVKFTGEFLLRLPKLS